MEGVTGLEIHRRLSNIHGAGNVMSLLHVYKWTEHLNIRWSNTPDKQQTTFPRDSMNNKTIACVRTLLVGDRRFIISKIHRDGGALPNAD